MAVIGAVAGVAANACLVYIGVVFFKEAYKMHKENKETKGGKK